MEELHQKDDDFRLEIRGISIFERFAKIIREPAGATVEEQNEIARRITLNTTNVSTVMDKLKDLRRPTAAIK